MSSIEERLTRDIAAVSGGVVVSDSDLREARTGVNELVESRRRRERLRTIALAAAAAAALVAVGAAAVGADRGKAQLAGPAANNGGDPYAEHLTGSAPTAQLVDGVWRLDNGETMVVFEDDGTVRFDDRGTLFSRPDTTGTYEISGDLITVTTTADDEAGCIGTQFAMRASFPEPGDMRFVHTEGSGTCSALPPARGALQKLLPTSPGMAELVFSSQSGWKPVSQTATLHGVWLAEGGGHLLELDPDGSYVVVAGSGQAVDRGEWSLRDRALTLTSSSRSTTCSGGDQLVLAQVEWVDPGTSAFRGRIERNACGGTWTPAAWFLVPHADS